MKLHLETIGDIGLKSWENKYVALFGPLSMDQIVKNKNHNIMMIDIAYTLSYDEFNELKYCPTTHEMWNKLKDIYEGDDNVRRAKPKSLRGQFD